MNTRVYLVLCCFFTLNSGSYFLHSVEDHFWRDYHGLVPSDAVKGGINQNGENTFIGQMDVPAGYNSESAKIHTIPVTISYGNRTAIGTYNGKTITSNDGYNLKILCAPSSNYYYKFESRTSSQQSNCRYVVVGLEDLVPMYAGRADHNREIVLGKIFSDDTHHYGGLVIPKDGGEYFPSNYTILTYCH